MIKFFRKIRQKLLSEGKTGTYLKYAIGEIVLVVFGILIALQINTWNEDRKLKALEKNYISSFISDIKSDLKDLERCISITKGNQRAAENLISILNSNTPFNELILGETKGDTLDLIYSITRASFLTFPNVNKFALDDLKSSGNTKIISNDSLKRALFGYYSKLEVYNDWVGRKVESLKRYNAIKSEFLNPYLISLINQDSISKIDILETKMVDLDSTLKLLRTTPKLRVIVNGVIYSQVRILTESKARNNLAKNILSQLESELERK